MAKEKYTLYGAMFLYKSYPNDIYPVFQNGNDFFYQDNNDSTIINSFKLIEKDYYLLIKPIDEKCIRGELEDYYSIGSDCVFGYQLSNDSYFLGNLKSLVEALDSGKIDIDDPIINEEINELRKMNDINNRGQYILK